VDEVLAARPYAAVTELAARSDLILGGLPWGEIDAALAAHPRIGAQVAGTAREDAWSRSEQSGLAASGDEVAVALRAGNIAYEQRFGRVFLICATGLTGAEMLAALRERLEHDEATERAVIRRELAAIVRLRLVKAFGAVRSPSDARVGP
jgi:2-oxo-4-hydroxy-4-carboxy-5-ureidoimidazoline decarboxylase